MKKLFITVFSTLLLMVITATVSANEQAQNNAAIANQSGIQPVARENRDDEILNNANWSREGIQPGENVSARMAAETVEVSLPAFSGQKGASVLYVADQNGWTVILEDTLVALSDNRSPAINLGQATSNFYRENEVYVTIAEIVSLSGGKVPTGHMVLKCPMYSSSSTSAVAV